jgi:hypothetical protein
MVTSSDLGLTQSELIAAALRLEHERNYWRQVVEDMLEAADEEIWLCLQEATVDYSESRGPLSDWIRSFLVENEGIVDG